MVEVLSSYPLDGDRGGKRETVICPYFHWENKKNKTSRTGNLVWSLKLGTYHENGIWAKLVLEAKI